MNKKILSLALAGVMLVCNMSGTTAFAAQATTQAVQPQAQTTAADHSFCLSSGDSGPSSGRLGI